MNISQEDTPLSKIDHFLLWEQFDQQTFLTELLNKYEDDLEFNTTRLLNAKTWSVKALNDI
jgi:hypothetical protein